MPRHALGRGQAYTTHEAHEPLADAFSGRLADPKKTGRLGKGLISFADRLGVYEGVAI